MHSSTRMEASSHQVTSLSRLTGADALLDALVDSVIPQVRPTLPGVSAEQLRTRLLAFRPRFESIYQRVLLEHLGADLVQLANELREPRARAYFEARRSMAPELGQLLLELSLEMGKTEV
jgi:hypothetical protein